MPDMPLPPAKSTLVAGVDSSTQSVKIVVKDAHTGELIKSAKAAHPDGSEVDPAAWWQALNQVIAEIGGLDQLAAISIGGQQHGMVLLDGDGEVIRPALLWNDTRSSAAAAAINSRFPDIAARTGSQLVASFTASKILWVSENEPENSARVAAIALPHDWLSWKLSGAELSALTTDRSDASGTGYFNPQTNSYDLEILSYCLGRSAENLILPRVVDSAEVALTAANGHTLIAAGGGDNAAAAFGLNLAAGDAVVSLGTSGTVFQVSPRATSDKSGAIAGFAAMSGDFLPLLCTLNAARVLDSAAKLLGCSHQELSDLALAADPGAAGLTLIPYFEGERTPNLPDATGTLIGLTLANQKPENFARAYIEGMLCALADAFSKLADLGIESKKIYLIGGAAKNPAVGQIASSIFGLPVVLPPAGEYVALGAARQAAWIATGAEPNWQLPNLQEIYAAPTPQVLASYQAAASLIYK